MEPCVFCYESSEFDAVHAHEMVKICKVCAQREGISLLKKMSAEELEMKQKPHSVQERMAKMAGIRLQKFPSATGGKPLILPLVERASSHEVERLKLDDHFHWELARARRARGLTVRQLALTIGESESILAQLEKGMLPVNALLVLAKLEEFLQIRLKQKPAPAPLTKISGDKQALMGTEVELLEDTADELVEESS